MRNLESFIPFSDLPRNLQKTNTEYRKHEPARYLYRSVLDYTQNEKYSSKFYELVYVTLCAWNMNSRGARLSRFDVFCSSIDHAKDEMASLDAFELDHFGDDSLRRTLRELFFGLELVDGENPPLVTFSKTIHFFYPKLIAPIDRKYTIKRFFGWSSFSWSRERQFEILMEIHCQFRDYARKNELSKFLDQGWNRSIPKIIDNAIIGSF